MTLHKIDEKVFVSEQITVDQLPNIMAAGIKTIICNRPDHEGPNQPNFSIIKEAAEKLGIAAYYLPVSAQNIGKADVEKMQTILEKCQKPILGYCRSGSRSLHIYNLAK